jgi:methylated-DNA-[protein]-cysteine S-methyltransferase
MRKRMELWLDRIETPIGAVLVAGRGRALCALEFSDSSAAMMGALRARFGEVAMVERPDSGGVRACLRAYFAGTLDALAGLSVDAGGSDFQRQVWRALRAIAPGKTLTYTALAERLNMPKAVRAVAHANALNPVSIVVPCHRVIGTDGSLRGYSGGLERKRWLLVHEGAVLRRTLSGRPYLRSEGERQLRAGTRRAGGK